MIGFVSLEPLASVANSVAQAGVTDRRVNQVAFNLVEKLLGPAAIIIMSSFHSRESPGPVSPPVWAAERSAELSIISQFGVEELLFLCCFCNGGFLKRQPEMMLSSFFDIIHLIYSGGQRFRSGCLELSRGHMVLWLLGGFGGG